MSQAMQSSIRGTLIRLLRASLDAYADPANTESLQSQWSATRVTFCRSADGVHQSLVISTPQTCILAFRGTSTIAEAKRDLRACGTRADFAPGMVHSGFLDGWELLRNGVLSALLDHSGDGAMLYVTGHSLGGAIATLAAVDMSRNGVLPRTLHLRQLATFGSPRVGDRAFARFANRQLGWKYMRVVHSNDIVARVPRYFRWSKCLLLPTGRLYHHCGRLVYLTEDGHLLGPRPSPSRLRIVWERLAGFRFDAVRDHFGADYLSALMAGDESCGI